MFPSGFWEATTRTCQVRTLNSCVVASLVLGVCCGQPIEHDERIIFVIQKLQGTVDDEEDEIFFVLWVLASVNKQCTKKNAEIF